MKSNYSQWDEHPPREEQNAASLGVIWYQALLAFVKSYETVGGASFARHILVHVFIHLVKKLLALGIKGEEMRVMIMEFQDELEDDDVQSS